MSATRVMVVDDEPLIRWSLREALADRGFDVVEAADGQSALRTLAETAQAPDVVLLDYRLPDSDDLSLFTKIKALMHGGQVILMTAYGTPEVTNGALDLGAFSVITKPFEVSEIAAIISEAHRAGA